MYIDYKNQQLQSAEYVLTSILKQLTSQLRNKLPTMVESAYDKYEKSGQLKRPDADEFAEMLIACSKEFSTVFVVIDAINECGTGEREKLLMHLQRFHESGVRLYITTREHLLNNLQPKFPDANILQIKAEEADVENYLREKLRTQPISDKFKNNILQTMKAAAQGKY